MQTIFSLLIEIRRKYRRNFTSLGNDRFESINRKIRGWRQCH